MSDICPFHHFIYFLFLTQCQTNTTNHNQGQRLSVLKVLNVLKKKKPCATVKFFIHFKEHQLDDIYLKMSYLKLYILIYQEEPSCNAFGSSVLLVCLPKYFHLLSSCPFLLFLHPFTFILCLAIPLAISVLMLGLKGNSFWKISSAVDMRLLAVHTSLPPTTTTNTSTITTISKCNNAFIQFQNTNLYFPVLFNLKIWFIWLQVEHHVPCLNLLLCLLRTLTSECVRVARVTQGEGGVGLCVLRYIMQKDHNTLCMASHRLSNHEEKTLCLTP